MRRLILLLIPIMLISCASTEKGFTEGDNIQIWNVTSYIKEGNEVLNDKIKDIYITRNRATGKEYITYLFTGDATYKLEENWKRYNKDLRLDRVHVILEFEYTMESGKLIIDSVKEDFVIKGENTKEVIERINQQIYPAREGGGLGLIPLILSIWFQDVLDYAEEPFIQKGDTYDYKLDQDHLITISNDLTTVEIELIGEHMWVGY